MVSAFDLATGERRWRNGEAARHETPIGGIGPRSVPTVEGGRVFVMGATGRLRAIDAASGRSLWSRDVLAEHDAVAPEWGKSCSPLVAGGRVIVSAGGPGGHSLVAYDAATGEPAWHGGDDRSGFSSPFLVELAGALQVVIFNQASLAGHDPADGRLLWEFAWPNAQPNVSQPVPLSGDRLFASSGYGVGGKLLQIERDAAGDLSARLLWETPRLKAKFTNVVEYQGRLYGLDDGTLVCLDPATGERCWKEGRYGHGQVILAGGLLLVQSEDGQVALIEPDPGGLKEPPASPPSTARPGTLPPWPRPTSWCATTARRRATSWRWRAGCLQSVAAHPRSCPAANSSRDRSCSDGLIPSKLAIIRVLAYVSLASIFERRWRVSVQTLHLTVVKDSGRGRVRLTALLIVLVAEFHLPGASAADELGAACFQPDLGGFIRARPREQPSRRAHHSRLQPVGVQARRKPESPATW